MLILIAGLIVFLGVHSLRIVAPDFRDRQVAAYGEAVWKGVYSIVAFAGLLLIIWGYGITRVDPVIVWYPPIWTRHLALLLMAPVFVLLLAAYLPGYIKSTLKHPMLVGVKLWALAHLLANGTLADIVLFGGFLIWAVADRISVKRRDAQPPLAVARAGWGNDMIAVAGGLALYLLFIFYLHEALFGAAPLS
jgi:uncharacterized membrane protein